MRYFKYISFIIGMVYLSIVVFAHHNNRIMRNGELFSNVEAITTTETVYLQYCRCHNDGVCYGGNQISFRPLCGTYNVEIVGPDDPINPQICAKFQCEN